jgi:hypothetical protein
LYNIPEQPIVGQEYSSRQEAEMEMSELSQAKEVLLFYQKVLKIDQLRSERLLKASR